MESILSVQANNLHSDDAKIDIIINLHKLSSVPVRHICSTHENIVYSCYSLLEQLLAKEHFILNDVIGGLVYKRYFYLILA